ncbi:MAG TPA: phospholipase D-like domain-containing protein [Gemmatimonadaceae bacterium]|nr:phospholipase D-like domain-containing protein [Gemmatimonadaceae bacterium]
MTALAATVLVILVLALTGFLFITRGTRLQSVRAVGERDHRLAVTDPLFVPTMELLTRTAMPAGSTVELLTNGDGTFPRLWSDLRAARRSITVEMYYAQPGRVADTLAAILRARAHTGVRVLFLYDAFGAQNLTDGYLDSLHTAGISSAAFHPVHWYSLHRSQQRTHVRAVVIDGVIGYTGGFGIADKWLGDGRHLDEWRDTNVRIAGPAVMQLQAAFAAGWLDATGQLLVGPAFFPLPLLAGDSATAVHGEPARTRPRAERASTQHEAAAAATVVPQLAGVLHTSPGVGSGAAERFLALSLAGASHTLYVTNSYFVPDDDFVALLIAAARRGVDVRVLTAGEHTDIGVTRYAGRALYERLLRAGVRVYEYRPTMIHAKTLVVDGVWSSVGTMNFDTRSVAFNEESNLLVQDARFGAAMDSLFLSDLRFSTEITLGNFARRGWLERVKEWGAHRIARVL